MKTIQQLYEEAFSALLPLWKKRKELEKTKKELVKPLREQLQKLSEPIDSANRLILSEEALLKLRIVQTYQDSLAKQQEAYQRSLEAQKAGDMEAVKKATLEAFDNVLNVDKSMYFREHEYIEVTDIKAVPPEFLEIRKDLLEAALTDLPEGASIPGIARKTRLIVVVKDNE